MRKARKMLISGGGGVIIGRIFCLQRDRQTDMFIWSLIQEIVRRLKFPNSEKSTKEHGGYGYE